MNTSLIDTRFLDALASAEPTPGGGSAAAMAGAIAAGLASMVCQLTRGQRRFSGVEADIERILGASEDLRAGLTELAEEDMAAYGRFAEAQHLPRATEDQRRERTAKMQEALRECTLVPLRIASSCRELLWLCPELVEKGNPAAVTDAGVAALLAEAALRGAALQVLVNLAWLRDDSFIRAQRQSLAAATAGVSEMRERVVTAVEAMLQPR